jgi:hypothetical protein
LLTSHAGHAGHASHAGRGLGGLGSFGGGLRCFNLGRLGGLRGFGLAARGNSEGEECGYEERLFHVDEFLNVMV